MRGPRKKKKTTWEKSDSMTKVSQVADHIFSTPFVKSSKGVGSRRIVKRVRKDCIGGAGGGWKVVRPPVF